MYVYIYDCVCLHILKKKVSKLSFEFFLIYREKTRKLAITPIYTFRYNNFFLVLILSSCYSFLLHFLLLFFKKLEFLNWKKNRVGRYYYYFWIRVNKSLNQNGADTEIYLWQHLYFWFFFLFLFISILRLNLALN